MGKFFNTEPIWISGDNRGDTVVISDVLIGLPKAPPKKQMLNYGVKKKDQKWSRVLPPKTLRKNNTSDYEDFINQELDRIDNGVWILINGIATFITGLHYYYINYIRIDSGYPEYRDRDRRFFYFWAAATKDKKCLGVTMVKPRRMGASWFGAAMLLYYGTRAIQALLGIVSKKGKDARSFFRTKLFREFKSLPFWLKPSSSSGTNPTQSLEFAETTKRGKDTQDDIDDSGALDTTITWTETTEDAFDGEKLLMLMFDEVGKIPKEIRLGVMWETISKCLLVGFKVVGKAFLPSTVNDLDKGGEQFKELFMNSRLSEAVNGQTQTGLWAYFVPAWDGLEGFIDEYGMSIVDDPDVPVRNYDGEYVAVGAKTELKLLRAQKKKISKAVYMQHVRQFPWTIEEAFYFDANTATLDIEKITAQINYEENERLTPGYTRGDLVWAKTHREVIFIPSENGPFKFSWRMPPDMMNNYVIRNGKRAPGNAMFGVLGLDPYEVSITSDGRGSKAGLHGHTAKINAGREDVPYYKCFMEYIHRAESVTLSYDDALKAAVFTGMPILFENNKYGFARHAEACGLGEYVLHRPKNTYPKDKRYIRGYDVKRGYPSNQDTNEFHAGLLQTYTLENIGENEDGQMGDFPWVETLKQMARFNIPSRGDLDGCVSLGTCLIELDNRKPVDLSKKTQHAESIIDMGKITINN